MQTFYFLQVLTVGDIYNSISLWPRGFPGKYALAGFWGWGWGEGGLLHLAYPSKSLQMKFSRHPASKTHLWVRWCRIFSTLTTVIPNSLPQLATAVHPVAGQMKNGWTFIVFVRYQQPNPYRPTDLWMSAHLFSLNWSLGYCCVWNNTELCGKKGLGFGSGLPRWLLHSGPRSQICNIEFCSWLS